MEDSKAKIKKNKKKQKYQDNQLKSDVYNKKGKNCSNKEVL